MPFGDGRGPLWASHGDYTLSKRYCMRDLGKSLGRKLRGIGRRLDLGYCRNYFLESNENKEYLEEEKRYLQERLREIDSMPNR